MSLAPRRPDLSALRGTRFHRVLTKIRTSHGPARRQRTAYSPCVRLRAMKPLYHQQTMNLLVSYAPKKLGFF
jgi:hypothetical protein